MCPETNQLLYGVGREYTPSAVRHHVQFPGARVVLGAAPATTVSSDRLVCVRDFLAGMAFVPFDG